MKRVIAIFSSFLIFAGLKAQILQVKKETVKADTIKQIKVDTLMNKKLKSSKQDKNFKFNTMKQTEKVQFKETKAATNSYIKK